MVWRVNLWNGLFEVGMLISGSLLTSSKKLQNESVSRGWGNSPPRPFDHPWVQTSLMFSGEALCMLAFLFQRRRRRRHIREAEQQKAMTAPLMSTAAATTDRKVFQPVLLLPATLDLIGTSCAGIGLVYCEASVYQMLRGSVVIFASVLSWLFLHRRMLAHRWVAICFTIVGLVLVSLSGLLSASLPHGRAVSSSMSSASSSTGSGASVTGGSSSGDGLDPVASMSIGVVMILTGQMVTGVQIVVEEMLIKLRHFEPMHIVGFEGVLGFLSMFLAVLPLMFFIPGYQPSPLPYTVYENVLDAALQIFRNWQLLSFVLVYTFSSTFFSMCGLFVTKNLSCVHRTVIDACRTILVWSFELVLHYATGRDDLGERWTRYSWIQVVGFLFLLLGAVLFNGILRIPGFVYEKPELPPMPPPGTGETASLLANSQFTDWRPRSPYLDRSSGAWDEQ